MRKLSESFYLVCLTAWIGGLWTVGYLVAPTLFASLADRQSAGMLAGKLFALIGWVGLGAGLYLVAFLVARWRGKVFKLAAFWLLLLMLLLTAASQFGIQPLMAQLKAEALPRDVMESVLKDRFIAWHGISNILYLIQSLFGLWLVATANRGLK